MIIFAVFRIVQKFSAFPFYLTQYFTQSATHSVTDPFPHSTQAKSKFVTGVISFINRDKRFSIEIFTHLSRHPPKLPELH